MTPCQYEATQQYRLSVTHVMSIHALQRVSDKGKGTAPAICPLKFAKSMLQVVHILSFVHMSAGCGLPGPGSEACSTAAAHVSKTWM
eukprot:1048769-Amphidinium_carterae.1